MSSRCIRCLLALVLPAVLAIWTIGLRPTASAEDTGTGEKAGPSKVEARRVVIPGDPEPARAADLESRIGALEGKVYALEQGVKGLQDTVALKSDIAGLRGDIQELKSSVAPRRPSTLGAASATPGSSSPSAVRGTGPVTRDEFEALKDSVLYQNEIIGQTAVRVADGSGSAVYVPDIQGSMSKSPAFRQQMQEAVDQSMRQRGWLFVDNRTAWDRSVRINNGRPETVAANQGRWFEVPVGTVTTELLGQEGPKHWMIGPPNYRQDIQIVPRPSAPIILAPPVVYGSPIIVNSY